MKKSIEKQYLTLSILVLCGFASYCGSPAPVSGPAGEWIQGKTLSIKIEIQTEESGWETGLLSIRNDSEKVLAIVPLKITGWYKAAGKKVFELPKTMAGGEVPPGKIAAMLVLGEDPFSDSLLSKEKAQADTLEKIEISIGKNELFIIKR